MREDQKIPDDPGQLAERVDNINPHHAEHGPMDEAFLDSHVEGDL